MGYELITSTVVAWFLAQAIKSAINPANGDEKKLKETLGHTGFQVFSGSVLGVIVSVIINMLFK